MPKTIELKTHAFTVHFNDGTSVKSYSEDQIDCEADIDGDVLVDGLQSHLEALGSSGMVQVSPALWRPHGTIKAVQLIESNVTSVVEVEFNPSYQLWEILSEE